MGRRALWQRWLVLVTAGELAGFSLPAAVGVWSAEARPAAQLFAMATAGLFEGALLGLAQALVLQRVLPGFRPRAWIAATSLAAAAAWFLGMLPAATHDTWSTWPVGWTVVAGAGGGLALLCSIGLAQALVTPQGVRRVATWVGWTALGWGAGLTAFGVIAPPLWHEGQAPWALTLIGLCGGLAMALAMAAVTGLGAVRLVARAHDPKRRSLDPVTRRHHGGSRAERRTRGHGTFGSNEHPAGRAGSNMSGTSTRKP